MSAHIVVNEKMAKYLTIFLLFSASIFGSVVDDGIRKISWHDRICMKTFFDHAIKYDQAAHVLFFENKPACIIATILKHKNKPFSEVVCFKGWKAFKKHEHLFPHPNFIFSENVVDFDEDFRVLHIYILNRQSIARCFEQYLSIFKKELGETFSSETFVTKLEDGEPLPSLLNENEMLLGLLLGFGEESSRAFKEAADQKIDLYESFDLKQPKGCKIFPVAFMGNPHSNEVQNLCSIYESELEKIWEVYKSSKDRLKLVLQKLCE